MLEDCLKQDLFCMLRSLGHSVPGKWECRHPWKMIFRLEMVVSTVCPIGGWFRMQNPSYNGWSRGTPILRDLQIGLVSNWACLLYLSYFSDDWLISLWIYELANCFVPDFRPHIPKKLSKIYIWSTYQSTHMWAFFPENWVVWLILTQHNTDFAAQW